MANKRSKKKSNTKLYLFLGGVIILALGGAYFAKQKGLIGKETYTKVATEASAKRTIIETVSANGKLYPETEVKVNPDVSGEIVFLGVEEGDSVKQGVLVARIQPDLQETFVEQAEAAVNSAKSSAKNIEAGIAQFDLQIAQARTDLARVQQLFDQDVASLVELQNTKLALSNLEAQKLATTKQLEAANFNIKSAEAGLKESRKNLGRTNIYAPITGIVSSLSVEKGERVVGTSQFEGTELMRISNYSNFEVQVEVSENDIIKVSEGDDVLVEIDAYYKREFKGRVIQISNSTGGGVASMLSSDQVTNYTVKIILLQSSYEDLLKNAKNSFIFRPGMSASVEILTNKLENIVTVPIQAVTVRELADSLQKDQRDDNLLEVVFVYSNGKVEQRSVETGVQDDTYIEVKTGLKAEEEIVNAPYRAISKNLKHDMKVEKVDKKDLFSTGDGE